MAWSGGPGTDVMIFFHFYRIFWQKKWRFWLETNNWLLWKTPIFSAKVVQNRRKLWS
jgi:hypothetical protein